MYQEQETSRRLRRWSETRFLLICFCVQFMTNAFISNMHWLKISALNADHALPGYQTHDSGVASAIYDQLFDFRKAQSAAYVVTHLPVCIMLFWMAVPLWDVLINVYSAILSFSLPHVVQTCMTLFILSLKHKRRLCRTEQDDVKCQSKDVFENVKIWYFILLLFQFLQYYC